MFVLSHQGQPVSQIGIYHSQLHAYGGLVRVGSVGGVCTHPDYRGYGLASRLMDHCTRQLVQEGARLMLISGGRGLYTRLGAVPLGRYACFTLKPGSLRRAEIPVKLRPATRADAALCSQLYAREPVRFERRVSRFDDHFRIPEDEAHAEEWIIEMDGQPAGYLMLFTPWDFVEHPEAGIRYVWEYAGSRLALVAALELALRESPLQEVTFPVPWQESDLITLLRLHGASDAPDSCPDHTARIINFSGLMSDLRPYLHSRLSAHLRRGLRFEQRGALLHTHDDDVACIQRGPARLELDVATMTRLVCGDPGFSQASLSVPEALSETLAAIFPLPAFLPGLNYQ
jgi:hypothetical protein